jgi:hypothetical protein
MNSLTKVCGMACALDFAEKKTVKAKKKKEKEFDKETARMKRENNQKSLKWQHAQCQPVFNKLRRLQEFKWFKDRGLEPTCISCGEGLGNDGFCNGHYKSVGSSSALRYDFVNSYLQHNVRCNKHLSADINGTATTHGYNQGLINRFGYEEAKAIMEYCETNMARVTRYEWQELESMRKEWNAEIRKLEEYLK